MQVADDAVGLDRLIGHFDTRQRAGLNAVRGSFSTFRPRISIQKDRAGGRALSRIGDAPHHRSCSKAFLQESGRSYAASWEEALSVSVHSVFVEETGGAASWLVSLTNPASHKGCQSAATARSTVTRARTLSKIFFGLAGRSEDARWIPDARSKIVHFERARARNRVV